LSLTLSLALPLALSLVLALLSLAAAVFTEAHWTKVVLAAASGRTSPPTELAGTATAGMALGAAVVVAASVVQGLDSEFGKGAGGGNSAFKLGKGGSY